MQLLRLSLLHFIFLLLLPLAFSSIVIAKPGCQDRCGNLSIPFPFGVGSNCSLEQSFNITCDTSTNPPKAYLSIVRSIIIGISVYIVGYAEVIEIHIPHGQIRVKYPSLLASACYFNKSHYWMFGTYFDFSATQYTLSDENWLTVIGCDDMVVGLGEGNKSFVGGGGCISFCADGNHSGGNGSCPDYGNGYSPGNGCCRAPISRGTTYLGANLTDLSEKWQRRKLFPCSYAFVGEKNQSGFSYPFSYLDSSPVNYLPANQTASTFDLLGAFLYNNTVARSSPPVVLDWRIGAENCSQAQRNFTNFACQNNSRCYDFVANVGGYRCRCLEGYMGIPYLTPGCKDIDECADPRLNSCHSNAICINTNGSYNCSCPHGYYGDGMSGTGCSRLPQSKIISVSIGLGSGLGFLLLLSLCFWLHKVLQKRKNKMRKQKFFKQNGGLLLQQQTNEGTLGKMKLFPVKELEKATDHFNESRILGQGGQGTVYKGMLSDGKIVAIKKSKLVDEDQLEQFINEVVILSQINHRNVVKLLGCCLETEVPLLVYEFVPNGTLFDLIHDSRSEFPVPWNMRLKIAADIAGAVAYLHSASSLPIYHRDIKSSNILLDEKYVVKVSDFGISRSVAVDQTHLTTLVKGTIGYLDPEYFQSSQFTEKSDVYSFGVVLVELLTGQRPISMKRTEEEKSLATRFLASMEANNLDSILDPKVLEEGRKEEVIAIARLARRCLNLAGKMRPTMREVATELESFRVSQMPSTVKDEPQEARLHAAKSMMISDFEYTWTTTGDTITSSSSDTHPFMLETV